MKQLHKTNSKKKKKKKKKSTLQVEKIKKIFEDKNIKVKSYNASLLWEPWNILKNDGTPYKVFTPFYRKGCLGNDEPRIPLPKPAGISYVKNNNSTNIFCSTRLPHRLVLDVFEKLLSSLNCPHSKARSKLSLDHVIEISL